MPLLERESALDALGGWFAEARAGRGRLVLVGGEAGVGKTALVEEFALRQALFPALLERLRDTRVATVLVIEDVHWADEATLDLLRFLARRLDPASTLLVVTYRDDEVGPTHPVRLLAGDLAGSALVRRVRLVPLSRQAVAALAGPHGVDPAAL
jgi:predicted ATPase